MSGYDQFFKEAGKASGLMSKDGAKSPKGKGGVSFKIKSNALDSREPGLTPEQQLRRRMTARLKQKKSQTLRKRQNFPVFPAICATVALLSCAVGYFRPEIADSIFGKIEIGAFGQANAAEDKPAKSPDKTDSSSKGEKSAATDAAKTEKDSATSTAEKKDDAPDVRGWSEEELSFFKKLNERKKELDQREAELNKVEEELQKQKAELDSKIKQLETMRSEISKTLKTRVATDQEKVDKLVQFYSNMKPAQAAKVIESLNEDLAVEVLDKLKKKNAAEIMDMMDAKKARKLSELLTGYQRSPASSGEPASTDGDAKDGTKGQEE